MEWLSCGIVELWVGGLWSCIMCRCVSCEVVDVLICIYIYMELDDGGVVGVW